MISINYNPSVLRTQNNLSKANNAMGVALHRMSTGFKINSAADDAAGLYIATGLNTQIRGLKQAQKNVSTGKSILSIAEGSLNNMSDMLNRVRDLALQGANSYYSEDSRGALQNEADKLIEEVTRIKKSTNFNGMNLFEADSLDSPSDSAIPAGYIPIGGVDELFKNISNNPNAKFILIQDLDYSQIDNSTITSFPAFRFSGVLDGNGHVIKNFNSTQRPFGIFESIENAEIKNLGFENINIQTNNSNPTGAITGVAINSTITNCYVKGDILGSSCVGGLVGISDNTTFNRCFFEGNVTGKYGNSSSNDSGTGGITGLMLNNSILKNSYAKGTITVNQANPGGGLAGFVENSQIANCYTDTVVTGNRGGFTFGIIQKSKIDNVIGNKKTNTNNLVYGSSTNVINNFIDSPESNFKDPGFWLQRDLNFDDNIWNIDRDNPRLMEIPPTLKNMLVPDPADISAPDETGSKIIRLQVGANSDETTNAIYLNIYFNLDALTIDFSTAESCLQTIKDVDELLNTINTKLASIGAVQNRLGSVEQSQIAQIENFSAAKSTIMDTDIAELSAEYTKQQILNQTSIALLVQANHSASNIALGLINNLR